MTHRDDFASRPDHAYRVGAGGRAGWEEVDPTDARYVPPRYGSTAQRQAAIRTALLELGRWPDGASADECRAVLDGLRRHTPSGEMHPRARAAIAEGGTEDRSYATIRARDLERQRRRETEEPAPDLVPAAMTQDERQRWLDYERCVHGFRERNGRWPTAEEVQRPPRRMIPRAELPGGAEALPDLPDLDRTPARQSRPDGRAAYLAARRQTLQDGP